jgi:ABC-type multidrug transport system ATPase subunit
LDPEERVRFRDLITDLGRERIVLLSTHIVSDVEVAASRILIMSHGRICADGTPGAVIGRHVNLEDAYLRYTGAARAA